MYKYQEIAEKLQALFTDGTYAPGAQLPDQETLAKQFDTTRITIRKAIQSLIIEGVVYTKRGAGTFLRKDYNPNAARQAASIEAPLGTTFTYQDRQVSSLVLGLEARLPAPDEEENLLIDSGTPVYDIRRVRYLDKKVYAYEHTIMPTKIATLTEQVLLGSLYSYLRDVAEIEIAGAHRQVFAIEAGMPDVTAGVAKRIGEPVLVIKQVAYTDSGEPFEYSESHFPFKTSRIVADVTL